MKQRILALALISILALPPAARAHDIDLLGRLQQDNDVHAFGFSLTTTREVTVFSSSWLAGGFDPVVALWDATGRWLAEQDDGLHPSADFGPTTAHGIARETGAWDVYLRVVLGPGSYQLTLAQSGNTSRAGAAGGGNLADGFLYDSDPLFPGFGHFTAQYADGTPRFPGATTLDFFGADYTGPTGPGGTWQPGDVDARTGEYALHLLNVEPATPPTPALDTTATAALLAASLALLVRRQRPKPNRH